MSEIYEKISTLYKRDDDFNVDTTKLTRVEFGLINKWVVTEKIDGMNICINFIADLYGHIHYNIWGRTKNAHIPEPLNAKLVELCESNRDNVSNIMLKHGLQNFKLFGEGYGNKINGGAWYDPDDQHFILFDVKADDRWLDEDQITKTAVDLNLQRVPTIPNPYSLDQTAGWSLRNITSFMENAEKMYLWNDKKMVGNKVPGAPSLIALDKSRNMEGIIARTSVPLYNRQDKRIIFKLKVSDFTHPARS